MKTRLVFWAQSTDGRQIQLFYIKIRYLCCMVTRMDEYMLCHPTTHDWLKYAILCYGSFSYDFSNERFCDR